MLEQVPISITDFNALAVYNCECTEQLRKNNVNGVEKRLEKAPVSCTHDIGVLSFVISVTKLSS